MSSSALQTYATQTSNTANQLLTTLSQQNSQAANTLLGILSNNILAPIPNLLTFLVGHTLDSVTGLLSFVLQNTVGSNSHWTRHQCAEFLKLAWPTADRVATSVSQGIFLALRLAGDEGDSAAAVPDTAHTGRAQHAAVLPGAAHATGGKEKTFDACILEYLYHPLHSSPVAGADFGAGHCLHLFSCLCDSWARLWVR